MLNICPAIKTSGAVVMAERFEELFPVKFEENDMFLERCGVD
jgi:hypothetical protein